MVRMSTGPRLWPTLANWWRENSARDGAWRAARRLATEVCEYLRDSLPDRRRQRYGDIDYDFDFHVNTTGATVSWRDRLLGHFLSPYQPTEPALFHEMLAALAIDFSQFTFVDLGSGKGRTLLMASDYPFRKIVGVELLPALHRAAEENVQAYRRDTRKCLAIELVLGDARGYVLPNDPLVLYLFNPLPKAALVEVIDKLGASLRAHARPLYVIYHNPLLESVVARQEWLTKIAGTHQYVIFTGR
jgi:hypothetical protein